MNLSWYKNIKTLLKLDNLYHMDHVSAFKYLHQEKDITTDSSQHSNHLNNSQLNKYKHLKPINPISCKKYRIEPNMKSLKDHFQSVWNKKRKTPPSYFFYNKIQLGFEKKPYLDFVKNATAKSRYCTTRLRISAYNLEIEYGRYKNIPREQRKCKWCDLALNKSHLENKHLVHFECDLYANIRSKLVRTLNSKMGKFDCNLEIGQKNTLEHAFRANSVSNLSKHILEIQSNCENYLAPITAGINQNTIVNPRGASYHDTINPLSLRRGNVMNHNLNNILTLDKIRELKISSYLHNAISSFVSNCFKNRDAFLEDLKSRENAAS